MTSKKAWAVLNFSFWSFEFVSDLSAEALAVGGFRISCFVFFCIGDKFSKNKGLNRNRAIEAKQINVL